MRVRRSARAIGHLGGFTYLTALFAIGFVGVGLALVGEVWRTITLREREAELLFAGNQYRRAIERYYAAGPQQYPRSLSDLLKDPRKPTTERHLRRLYADPITAKDEWGLVRAPDGGIMGVYSLSEDKPLKIRNFRLRDGEFEGKSKYLDWKFVFTPGPQPSSTPAPASAVGRQDTPRARVPVK